MYNTNIGEFPLCSRRRYRTTKIIILLYICGILLIIAIFSKGHNTDPSKDVHVRARRVKRRASHSNNPVLNKEKRENDTLCRGRGIKPYRNFNKDVEVDVFHVSKLELL